MKGWWISKITQLQLLQHNIKITIQLHLRDSSRFLWAQLFLPCLFALKTLLKLILVILTISFEDHTGTSTDQKCIFCNLKPDEMRGAPSYLAAKQFDSMLTARHCKQSFPAVIITSKSNEIFSTSTWWFMIIYDTSPGISLSSIHHHDDQKYFKRIVQNITS